MVMAYFIPTQVSPNKWELSQMAQAAKLWNEQVKVTEKLKYGAG